ncbi:ABC transporter permease subunit [Cohnella lubricantis]|uniref:ABC transporter permease subunit n=1 Tax=Cohnella lubricantis TaxID=2163172 RepID=A0A841TH65_9BACL|nr:ABC transporter permease subunit [Cohnella lubricantis]MBB6679485.1 ABC transporter permease subunit [Cohnella lubricantis]MBP2118751.1 ABC-2 type transport system permease protein [Cohnella lubricantis]
MNTPLFRQMMKVNAKGISNYAVGSAFYMLLMFWLYPSIAENSADLNDMVESLPAGLVNAFGFENGFGSMESFISGEYYGLILPLLLSIFSIMLSTQLMARLVDRGSMAYLLATPTTRGRVAFTQAAVLVCGLFVIVAVTTASGFAGSAWIIGGRYAFDASRFLLMNAVIFLLFFAISGLSFFFSSIVNDEKRALSISGAVTIGMFSLDLLGKISGSVEWLRYLSAFSLFRPADIASGGGQIAVACVLLPLIGLLGFAAGIAAFRRRDLPL